MSAPAGHPALRARISDQLLELVQTLGGAEIARRIGIDRTTPSRRGGDTALWPLIEALDLAITADVLRDALVAYMAGTTNGRPIVDTTRTLFDCLNESAQLVAEAARDLADGRIDEAEALRLLPHARGLRDSLANKVIPSLEALTRG